MHNQNGKVPAYDGSGSVFTTAAMAEEHGVKQEAVRNILRLARPAILPTARLGPALLYGPEARTFVSAVLEERKRREVGPVASVAASA